MNSNIMFVGGVLFLLAGLIFFILSMIIYVTKKDVVEKSTQRASDLVLLKLIEFVEEHKIIFTMAPPKDNELRDGVKFKIEKHDPARKNVFYSADFSLTDLQIKTTQNFFVCFMEQLLRSIHYVQKSMERKKQDPVVNYNPVEDIDYKKLQTQLEGKIVEIRIPEVALSYVSIGELGRYQKKLSEFIHQAMLGDNPYRIKTFAWIKDIAARSQVLKIEYLED